MTTHGAAPFARTSLLTGVACVFAYYISSIAITLYNKYMFTHGSRFPLVIVCFHQTGIYLFSLAYLRVRGIERPSRSWREALRDVPAGASFAVDLGLSNLAFAFVSVTFYQIVKSQMPAWTLAISLALGLARFSWLLVAAFACIVGGTALAVAHSFEVNVLGLVLLTGASAAGAGKLVCFQLMYQHSLRGMHPLVITSRLAPIVAILLLPFALALEGTRLVSRSPAAVLETIALALLGIVFGIALVLSELLLVGKTTAVTAQVLGICKEVLLIGVAATMLHEPVTAGNVVGLLVAFVGIGLFTAVKVREANVSTVAPAAFVALAAQSESADGESGSELGSLDLVASASSDARASSASEPSVDSRAFVSHAPSPVGTVATSASQ